MTSIPPHHSERYINQRYSKALQIVQHLPPSSGIQPTKDQKLELYALYKQVSHGKIDTQRPGIFDVVGRAKWDAWKRLEGMSKLEAKHRYVEILLDVVTEAYKRPSSKLQAQQIIQTFATIRPPNDSDSDDQGDTDDSDEDQEPNALSAEAEEQAYLWNVQRSMGPVAGSSPLSSQVGIDPSVSSSVRGDQQVSGHRVRDLANLGYKASYRARRDTRATSVTSSNSTMSVATAPSGPSYLSRTPSLMAVPTTAMGAINDTTLRVHSAGSNHSVVSAQDRRSRIASQRERVGMSVYSQESLYDEHMDDTVNPWLQQTTAKSRNQDHDSQSHGTNKAETGSANRSQLSQLSQPQHPAPSFHRRSPLINSSISSIATIPATRSGLQRPSNRLQQSIGHRPPMVQNIDTIAGLDPATRRALELLRTEILALHERMDAMKRESLDRPVTGRINRISSRSVSPTAGNDGDEGWDGWFWVVKAAIKHAVIHFLTAMVLFFMLYRSGSPVAIAVASHIRKHWQKLKTFGFSPAHILYYRL